MSSRAAVNRLAALALALTLLTTTATLAVVSSKSEAAAPLRIMPLGDSNTDGFNVPGGYRIALEDGLNADGFAVDFVGSLSNGPSDLLDKDHEGHIGSTIDGLRAGVAGWLSANPADIVLLMIGTNDLKLGTTTDGNPVAASQRLRALLVELTDLDVDLHVVVSTLPPQTSVVGGERTATFNEILPALVDDLRNGGRNVSLVDGAASLSLADLSDSLHLTSAGFAKLAGVWREGIAELDTTVVPSTTTTTVVPSGVGVLDGFERGDSVGLGSADVGGVWELDGAGFGVAGGAAVAVGGSGEGVALLDVGVDVSVVADVTLSLGRAAPGVSFRALDRRNQLLVSLVRRDGHDRVSLFKVDGGAYRELARVDGMGLVLGGSYVLRVDVVGSVVRVFVDGSLAFEYLLSGADAVTFGSRTKVGLRTYSSSGAEDGGSRWERFEATALN
ncbi:MAG: SGNH/GDSL hydrolase family protein [Solirubrobacterales bacterium]